MSSLIIIAGPPRQTPRQMECRLLRLNSPTEIEGKPGETARN